MNLIGLLLVFGCFLFIIVTTNWKHWTSWVGVLCLTFPYIHIYISNDQISHELRTFYGVVCIIGLIFLCFINPKNEN